MSVRYSVWSGEVRMGSLVMRCHVLDDGTRIVEKESVERFMAWLGSDVSEDEVRDAATAYSAFAHGRGTPQ